VCVCVFVLVYVFFRVQTRSGRKSCTGESADTHTYIHTYIHAYIHAYIHTYLYNSLGSDSFRKSVMHRRNYMAQCAEKASQILTSARSLEVRVQKYTNTYIYIYIHIHIHIHIHTYIDIYWYNLQSVISFPDLDFSEEFGGALCRSIIRT
jgi:hypothetical protein